MTEAEAKRRGYGQRVIRSVESRPFGPFWLRLGLVTGIVALYLVAAAASGSLDQLFGPGDPRSLTSATRRDLVIICLIAFMLVTRRFESRRAREDLPRLRLLTRCSEAELAGIVAPSTAGHARRRIVEAVGALVGVAIIPASSQDPAFIFRKEVWDAGLVWSVLANAFLFALIARAVYGTFASRGVAERITREIVEIDLLDRSVLAPFARQGLRRAFFWAGGSSIASLLALDLERLWALFAILALTLLMATLALLEPVRAIHARLAEAKRAELARVRAEIQRVKEAALEPHRAGTGADALPGLLAYESRIEAVSEWPFDMPTRLGFGALVILAAGSWLGGAIVERLLGAVLD